MSLDKCSFINIRVLCSKMISSSFLSTSSIRVSVCVDEKSNQIFNMISDLFFFLNNKSGDWRERRPHMLTNCM